ncbi:MAG TPA: wax ester/triacylglycerol synthase family O-acyltransferase [Mycobacteriales bacterium]|nr:wax ester/triacylglycerol synthase family O-acyltransferase [Mycobacteriales bacterium]
MQQLRGVDALHVLEETRDQHMHTAKVALLAPGPDGVPTFDDVREWAQERLLRIPALRWMVRPIPLKLAKPVFLDAGPYDVGPHLHAETLPPPGGPVELDELVSRIASVQVDRSRPLWELTYVTGLESGSFDGATVALVFKLHHSIMDGQASLRFLELVFDGGEQLDFGPPPPAEPEPTKAQLVRFSVVEQAKLYGQLPQVLRRTVASIRDNRSRKKSGAPPVVNPLSGPSTRFNRWPVPERVYVDVTVPMADLRALRAATGRTINELFVTLCGGAIRRYLQAHGEEPDRCLNAAHPVSLRRPEERDAFGNRTSYWYVSLGTDVADPVERLAVVKASLDAAREWAKGDVELFAVWQDYYLLFGRMTLKSLTLAERLTKRPAFNAIVSNVRGPAPLSLNGAPVVAVRSMGPITRVLGLNLTAWSYRENFSIGLQACRQFMPDLRSFDEHLRAELAAFVAAAVPSEDERVAGVGAGGEDVAELREQR